MFSLPNRLCTNSLENFTLELSIKPPFFSLPPKKEDLGGPVSYRCRMAFTWSEVSCEVGDWRVRAKRASRTRVRSGRKM